MPASKIIGLDEAIERYLVGPKTICRRYKISPRTLDNWLREKRIPVIRVGYIRRFSIEACDRALEKFEVHAVEPQKPRRATVRRRKAEAGE